MLGPDDLGAAADHPAKKLKDFEPGVRYGSILHPPVAVPPPPFRLLVVTFSTSLHGHHLAWPVFWSQVGGV